MRFFAHDGKSTHGPAGIEELLKLPGFDGDTLVCPVGSDDPSDWKPALAYPPFKKALLEAPAAVAAPKTAAPVEQPKPNLPPMPALPSFASPAANQIPVPAAFPLPLPAAPAASIEVPKAPPPAPAPAAAKTVPCPRCSHANLEEARFCNSCGARMDGPLEEMTPSSPFDSPKSITNFPAPPEPSPAPASDPFAHLDPLRSFPAEPAPAPLPESPRRPLQPGKMGQLAALEESAPASSYSAPAPAPALAPEPAAAALPLWKRPPVMAAFAGAALVAAGLAYMALNKSTPALTVAELTPSAQAPMPESLPPPVAAPAPTAPLYTTPAVTSSPSIPAPKSRKTKMKTPKPGGPVLSEPPAAAAKPKRARKPRPARAAATEPAPETAAADGGETLIESREPAPAPKRKGKRAAKAASAQANSDGQDPLLEALLTDATQSTVESGANAGADAAPLAAPAEKAPPIIGQRPAAKPGQFSLPGLQRPVSASDRAAAPQARAPRPPEEEIAPTRIAGLESPALAEPGNSPPPPGIENEPAKAAEGDQLALVQVHEQFDFCAQLLSQGAYGDHYDTCLCKDTREAAPYRGRRGYYATAKKKEAGSGHLETSAKILSSKLDNGVAVVTARWKSGGADKGRDSSQNWKLEDGLWCQAP